MAVRTKLTPKERRFVEEYCRDGKFVAAQAVIRACYTENPASARQIGYVLVGKPHIQEAIEARMKELGERCAVTIETITKQLTDAYELAMCGTVDRGGDKALAIATASPAAAVAASMGLAKLHGLIIDKKAETTPDGKPLPPAEIRIVHVRPDDQRGDT